MHDDNGNVELPKIAKTKPKKWKHKEKQGQETKTGEKKLMIKEASGNSSVGRY